MDEALGYVPVRRRDGSEPFHVAGLPVHTVLQDFWRWAGSDLLGNTFRGWLAEFIVGSDLGVTEGARQDWEGFDLQTNDGVRIEVKASAYLQSWRQTQLSRPRFSIRRAKAWDPRTDTFTSTASRHSDVYVFCLLRHQDKATVDPLDLSQWVFYVLPTKVLDERCGSQQSVSLEQLGTLGAREAMFGHIGAVITGLLAD